MRFALALLLTLVLPACAGTNSARGPTAKLVKTGELPERQRVVLDAWKKGAATWEIERERVRRDPELLAFLVDNLVIEMVRAYDRSALMRPGQQPGPFERAQGELSLLADGSAPILAHMLALPDGIVAFLAADTLKRIGAAAVPEVAASLDEPKPEVRRRAAELLGELPDLGAAESALSERLARTVAKDEAWIVRSQAALALGARGSRSEHTGFAMGVLLRALADPDATVAERAAKALGTLGEPRAIPSLADALEAQARLGRPAVVSALQTTLASLSHDSKRREPDGWRAWWRAHEDAIGSVPAPEATIPSRH